VNDVDSDGCAQCARLQRENEQLQRELRQLRLAIRNARQYCTYMRNQWLAVKTMGERKGVPRGTWSLFRGCGEVARAILALLPAE
jgi:hypothetical protein